MEPAGAEGPEARVVVEDHDKGEMIDFDPSRVNEFIEDLDMYFDSQRPGKYNDLQKLAFVPRCVNDVDLKEFVRGWKKNGLPTTEENGATKPWLQATWEDAKTALRITYPTCSEDDQAADSLDEMVQSSRVSTHNAKYLQLHAKAGEALPPNSKGKIAIKRYINTLCRELHPDVDDGITQSIHAELTTKLNKGEITELQQAMSYAVNLDRNLDKMARKAGVPQGAYWSKLRRSKRVNAVTSSDGTSVQSFSDDNERTTRLESRMQQVELNTTKWRTDLQSAVETMQADVDKRLKTVESQCETTQDLCKRILDKVDSKTPLAHVPPSTPSWQGSSQEFRGSYDQGKYKARVARVARATSAIRIAVGAKAIHQWGIIVGREEKEEKGIKLSLEHVMGAGSVAMW
jgi:hypothetical protein